MSKMTNNKLFLLALAGLGAFASGPAAALGGMTVESNGGVEIFHPEDESYWFKIGGRIFVDQVWFDGDDNDASGFPSGSQIRKARVTFKGGVGPSWVYKLDVDFRDYAGSAGRAQFGEAFLGYTGCKNLWFAVGQISVPFGLENWASANDTPFMELAYPSEAFSPDPSIGLFGQWHGQMFTLAAALFHPGAGEEQGYATQAPGGLTTTSSTVGIPGSDPLAFGARLTFSPIHNEQTVYHAGVSARYGDVHNTQNSFDFITGLELRSRQSPVIYSGIPFNSSNSYDVWGFELAGRWGPFQAAGEYMLAKVDRDGLYATTTSDPSPNTPILAPAGNLNYHGFYVMATYVLTGESKEYDFDTGTFGKVHPRSSKGAWEIGARYSYLDLLSGTIFPSDSTEFAGDVYRPSPNTNDDMVGGAHGVTVGLTWWVNENVRFLANYNRSSLPIGQDIDAFGLRAQTSWG